MTQKKPPAFDGVQSAAEMLNGLPPDHQERLLASIAEKDPALAEELRKRMFTFENIARLDDRTLQNLLREVPTRKLALALRGASEDAKTTVFKNLSSRASEALREEIDALGPQRLSDAEAAQAEIVALAKTLLNQKT